MEKLKYKRNRKLIEITCDYCGEKVLKPKSEYNRNLKLNRHNFCSRSCSIKYANEHKLSNTTAWSNSQENKDKLKNICSNRKSELSSFTYTYNSVKNRVKECTINKQYLKELWENQNGICPYTGLKLILPTYSNLKDIPLPYRASLDRIDSSKGYIEGNVQFISTPINFLKSTMSDTDTKKYLKLISQYTSTFVDD